MSLPSPQPEAARAAYSQLIADVETFAGVLRARFPTAITCRPGCTGCCQQHITVSPLEADHLHEFIAGLDAATKARLRQQAQATQQLEAGLFQDAPPQPTTFLPEPEHRVEHSVPCPALLDGLCAVYASRPILCRTHGFPLLYATEEEDGWLDVCPLNFTDEAATITHNSVFDMTVVNTRLAAANIVFDAHGARRSMAAIILSATASTDSTR